MWLYVPVPTPPSGLRPIDLCSHSSPSEQVSRYCLPNWYAPHTPFISFSLNVGSGMATTFDCIPLSVWRLIWPIIVVRLIADSYTELQQSMNVSKLNVLSKNCAYPNRLIWTCNFIDDQTHIEIDIYVIKYSRTEMKQQKDNCRTQRILPKITLYY